MKTVSVQRSIQLSILIFCLVVLGFRIWPMRSQAQATCQPPLEPFNTTNPRSEAWPQGRSISVVVLDRSATEPTSEAELSAIDTGIRDWNTIAFEGCSNVTFGAATLAGFPWDGVTWPPNDTMWVVRSHRPGDGQFIGDIRPTGLRAGLLYMHADFNHQTTRPERRVDNLAKHEAGHGFGLRNGSISWPASVMSQNSFVNNTYVITQCDIEGHQRIYCPQPTPTPTPTPTPAPTPIPGGCNGEPPCLSGFVNVGGTCTRSQAFMQNCFEGGDYDFDSCSCTGGCGFGGSCSPIVVDVLGNGFSLTNANNGVDFDINNDGDLERHAWTTTETDDAWLALDRNGDGLIDNGKELFGNVSPQLPLSIGEERNGFRALALYDGPGYGGNSDGKVDHQDSIFSRLELWQDRNHNGVSESCEMFSLPDLGLYEIDLDYKEAGRVDQYGNQFKYRSKVTNAQGVQLGRWAWDVFLVVQQP